MVKIKICGVTNVSDALQAAELGADAVGLNFYAGSPRYVTKDKAAEIVRELTPFVEPVAIFVSEPVKQIKSITSELRLRTFQYHGNLIPASNQFNLNDFRDWFQGTSHLGHMIEMYKMTPGLGDRFRGGENPQESIRLIGALLGAMTDDERKQPDFVSRNRQREIAGACGVQAVEVETFLTQFKQLRAEMKQKLTVNYWQKFKSTAGLAAPDQLEWRSQSALRPLKLIPAFAIQDRQSVEMIAAYVENCRTEDQLPAAILVDAHVPGSHGGTGQTLPWELLADFSPGVPLILAGGLTSENVAQAIRLVRPYAVDVASGVESSPGKKDADKMKRFIDAVRLAV